MWIVAGPHGVPALIGRGVMRKSHNPPKPARGRGKGDQMDEEACLMTEDLVNASLPDKVEEAGFLCLENPLIELTETAHMTLFMVMMLFLACVFSNTEVANLIIQIRTPLTPSPVQDIAGPRRVAKR